MAIPTALHTRVWEVIKRLEDSALDETTSHRFRWGFNPPGPRRVGFKNFPSYKKAIYSTATNGNVVVKSDGDTYDVKYAVTASSSFDAD